MSSVHILISDVEDPNQIDIQLACEPAMQPNELPKSASGKLALVLMGAMTKYMDREKRDRQLSEQFGIPTGTYPIVLDKSQRDAVLMALAHLAVERPGWDYMLSEIAATLETPDAKKRVPTYEEFKRMYTPGVNLTPRPVAPISTDKYLIADDGTTITCKTCGRKSYNLNDVREKYCGFCHVSHEL